MNYWWCAECQANVKLGKHGRCEVCESEAVDRLSNDHELTQPVSVAETDADRALAHA